MWINNLRFCASINPFLAIYNSKTLWSYLPGRAIDMESKSPSFDSTVV